MSYQDTHWGGGLNPLQRSSRCILQPQPIGQGGSRGPHQTMQQATCGPRAAACPPLIKKTDVWSTEVYPRDNRSLLSNCGSCRGNDKNRENHLFLKLSWKKEIASYFAYCWHSIINIRFSFWFWLLNWIPQGSFYQSAIIAIYFRLFVNFFPLFLKEQKRISCVRCRVQSNWFSQCVPNIRFHFFSFSFLIDEREKKFKFIQLGLFISI